MITLYAPTETDFTTNGVGILDHDIQNPVVEEKKNDLFTLTFDYPVHAICGNRMAARMLVKADDPEDNAQIFRIVKLTKSSGLFHVVCFHIFYDLAANQIGDSNIVGQNGVNVIKQALAHTVTPHKFTGFSDITKTANIRVVRMSPVQFLLDAKTDNTFPNRFGGELKRVNYHFWMNQVRGSDNGVTIRWRKSLANYSATWDYKPIVTRIRPLGFDGIAIPEQFVDSPKIKQYENVFVKTFKYQNIKAIDPKKKDNDPDAVPLEQAQKMLRDAAKLEFLQHHVDDPQVSMTVNLVSLRNMAEYASLKTIETISPWDTVTVLNERDGLAVKVRLNRYQYNPLTHQYLTLALGSEQGGFTDISGEINRANSAVDDARHAADDARKAANDAAKSANGKNKVFYGPDKPANPADGDLWYKKNGDKTEMWRYDGKANPPHWVLVVDDATGEEVKKRVDEASKEAKKATDDANAAVDKANKAVDAAGFAKIRQTKPRKMLLMPLRGQLLQEKMLTKRLLTPETH